MKKILITSILALSLSSCGVQNIQQSLHPQYASWRHQGFSYNEYKIYSKAGFQIGNQYGENTPSDALFWQRANIPANQAVKSYNQWKSLGYTNSDIEYFFSQDITDPITVDHWQTTFEELYRKENYSNKTTIKYNGQEVKNNDLLIASYIEHKITQEEYTQALNTLNNSPTKIITLNKYTPAYVVNFHGESLESLNFQADTVPTINNNKVYQLLYVILNTRNGFSTQQSIDNITSNSNYILKRYYKDTPPSSRCSSVETIEPSMADQILGSPNNVVGNCFILMINKPQLQWLSPQDVIISGELYDYKIINYYITSNGPIKENLIQSNGIMSSLRVIGIKPKTFVNAFGSRQMLHSFKLLDDPL